MLVTTNWINDYLKTDISADEQAELLTAAGFPLEGREDLPSGDVRQDFEMTSNRGDCTCHLGLAREIAAQTGNDLLIPDNSVDDSGSAIEEFASVDNFEPELCPLYSARVIRGASVGESPEWLSRKLEDRGDIPRNSIVDATNFVLFEQGQPTHVFDLDKIAGNKIEIRRARDGETFLPLGEDAKPIKLTNKDLVIADAEKPVALAGVKGGAETSVTAETTNLLIESATFDPVIVREMSRRHNISSDSSFRFERGVHAAQVEPCANRLAGLLLEVGGGTLCKGVLKDGKPIPELITAKMRTEYCRERLGNNISDEMIVEHLNSIGFESNCIDGIVTAAVPYFRGDIHREIDLVEEVGRVHGYENIAIEDTLQVRVPASGGESAGRRAVLDSLAGMGFVECVTHSLISIKAANQFLLEGQTPLMIDDDRASAEPALRPSLIPSLLKVRKHNEDNGAKDLRLAELGSAFILDGNSHTERTELAIVMDTIESDGIGEIRGVINRVCNVLTAENNVSIRSCESASWLEPGGEILLAGNVIGHLGRLSSSVQKIWGLQPTIHVAQLYLDKLLVEFPPEVQSHELPKQPAIERDISIILDEGVEWSSIKNALINLQLEHLEDVSFVTTFRGKNIPTGKKSLTLKLRFRDSKRTLTHEEVNDPTTTATSMLSNTFSAEIRT
ncbi:MAG: phenylalanine--tRNA ligase subunit beta [Phycisphaerales bacterium]|nr:phenylalanine--tRNA ligase subunit beta [Planctomycetota bacterium]MBL6996849.1 phenylalanine--tRNA ligase subunit beta [Phycisphaerales bacterium]